jgi:hypothetical protein
LGRGEKEMAQAERRERRERDREAHRLFFLDRNDYIAPLLIVLGRLYPK